jgi:tRNA (guanine-N7-)-methyltransferase
MENTAAGMNGKLSAREIGIRSYVVRSGRMTDMQKDALARLYPLHGVAWDPDGCLDPEELFGSICPFVVEIGFGMGSATAVIAQELPHTGFLGLEVHAPGVGKLLSEIESRGIKNLRVCRHDAVEVVESMIEPGIVDGFHVFFPDPWPKKRHHKRRIMNPGFVRLMASRLRSGGYVYFVTDWEEYAEATLEVLSAEPSLTNVYDTWATRESWRPITKFEQRAINDGRPIRELKFTKG